MGHASLNYYARGYEKLDDSGIAKFIEESTAYSDIIKDVLSGEEHDDWDVEVQSKAEELMKDQNAMATDSDEEPESEGEPEDEDNAGDETLHGIDYSDDESENSDSEDQDPREEEGSEEDAEGREENEQRSEAEEDEMDQYVRVVNTAGFESDN